MTQVSPTRGGQRLLLPGIDKIVKRFKRPLLSFRQVAADMGTTRPCGTCQIHIVPSDVAYCILFLAVLVVFMFSFLRGGFSAPGEDGEKPSLPIAQAARTPPKRRLQPPYLATPPATPPSLGRRNYLPPGSSGDGPLALNFQTPDRASQVFLSSIFGNLYGQPAGRDGHAPLLTPDTTPERGGQARSPRTSGTLAPVTPSKSRNPSSSRDDVQSAVAYLATPPPSNKKRVPETSKAEDIPPSPSEFVATINERSSSGATAQTASQSAGSAAPDNLPRFLPTPTTAGRSSLKEATKRETDNAPNTASRSKFTAQKGTFLSDTLGFRVNRDGSVCDSEDKAVDTDDKADDQTDDQTDDQLFNSKSPFVFLGHTFIFAPGQTLEPYQALDLKLLIAREQGKPVVCDSETTEIKNTVGSILAYPMGYGKTVVAIALILANPPGKDFGKIETGCPANLIAVPSQGLIKQWRAELKAFSPTLRSLEFSPLLDVSKLRTTDVVLITYTQLGIQYSKYQRYPEAANTLFSVRWYRFIADESHTFRNPETKSAKAAWGIKKTHGLCLTGTPVQNSVRDFYALYRFLEVDYEGIIDVNVFYAKVYGKRASGPVLPGNPRRIYETLKKNFCIFRDPIDPITQQPILNLTIRKDVNVKIGMSKLEMGFYETIDSMRLQPLAKTTRLRQACAHPCLLKDFLNPQSNATTIAKRTTRKKGGESTVPLRPPTMDALEISSQFEELLSEQFLTSKLKKMLETLAKHPKEDKAIIFVNFTALIPSLEHALKSKNIGYTRYTGGMSDSLREASLRKIANDDKCRVLIMSIQAGALGLHIVACNIVMLLEPWWNPYRDDQAISRVHRIGQTRPVYVYHFVTMNTIESNSLRKTQNQKRKDLINEYGEFQYGEEIDYVADSECQ